MYTINPKYDGHLAILAIYSAIKASGTIIVEEGITKFSSR